MTGKVMWMAAGIRPTAESRIFPALLSCAITLMVLAFTACDSQDPSDCVCTEMFANVHVYVIDGNGAAVDSMRTTVTIPRTGDTLSFGGFSPGSGYYIVADDRLTKSIPSGGEWMVMEGKKDSLHFQHSFLIGTDPCRCHVEKIFGPDTIRI